MAYTQKDMSGTLFTNDRREKDSHPQWKGSLMIDGKEYWVSGWDKDAGRGTFISLSVQEKQAKRQDRRQRGEAGAASHDRDNSDG